MRITNQMVQRDALANLQSGMRRMADAQQRVSTGMRWQRASEDPVAAAGSMQARGSMRALAQFQRNIGQASMRASAEESVLDRLTETLTRAKELAMSQIGSTANAETRATVKAEVDQLLEFAIGLGNTRLDDEYLFGGN